MENLCNVASEENPMPSNLGSIAETPAKALLRSRRLRAHSCSLASAWRCQMPRRVIVRLR